MTESESVALPFGDGPMCFMSLNKWYYTWNPYKCQPIFSNFFKKGVAIFGTLPYNNTCRQALRKTPQQRASTISNGPSPNGKATDSDSVISRFESLWASSLESTMQMVLFCYTGNYVIPVFLRRTMICINLKAVSDSAKWTVSFI